MGNSFSKLKLKKIELVGFKSFAEKTVLQFHPGITAIVGPNGCGKSNISDAFRWVLGEQSAKSMRGNKMNDVIFAGTAKRKPVNLAEVIITLDGNVSDLPTQYEEIAVGRRLFRDGESEYLLNRSCVRLKDIQDLFLDSGIGKNAFSIFEQGKLDQVINFSPLERRFIFEEAAGISRFLQRKKEALRRLEQTELNISRVLDIHQEIKRQIVILEEQAKKATLFKENKTKLDRLEIALFIAKWDDLQKKLNIFVEKENSKKQQIEELNRQIHELENERQNFTHRFIEAQKQLQLHKETVLKIQSEQEIRLQEQRYTEERLKEMFNKEQRWSQELSEMGEKRKLRLIESEQILSQQCEVEKRLSEQENLKKLQKEKLSFMEVETSGLRNQQKETQRELVQFLNQEKQADNEKRQIILRLEHVLEKKSRLQENKEHSNRRISELSLALEEKKQFLKSLNEKNTLQKNTFSLLDKQIQDLNEKIKEVQNQLNAEQKERAEFQARRNVLLKLREEMQGFSLSTKKLLQASANPASPLYNKVRELYQTINPNSGTEKALGSVMKPYMQTLVVSTKKDLELVLNFAQENHLNNFSVVCLEHLPTKEPAASPQNISFLCCVSDNKLSRHFLAKIYHAKDIIEGLQLISSHPEASVWTEQNLYIDSKLVIVSPAEGESNIFLREAEINQLFEKIEHLDHHQQKLEEVFKALTQDRLLLQTEKTKMDQMLRQQEVKLAEEKFTFQQFQSDLSKIKKDLDTQIHESQTLEDLSRQLQNTISELNHKHVFAKAKLEEIQKLLEVLNEVLDKKTAGIKTEQQTLQEKELIFHKITEEKRKLVHQLNLLEVKDFESIQQEKRLEEELKSIRENKLLLQKKTKECQGILEKIQNRLIEETQTTNGYDSKVQEMKIEITKQESTISTQQTHSKLQENELNQIHIEYAKIDSAAKALEAELRERYQLELETARSMNHQLDVSIEKTERSIRTLRKDLDAAGDVNMTSIEEFSQLKTRYEFLSKQLEDLTLSKQELVQIITQLDSESRKMFKDIFEKVRENFKKNFKILFVGGEADLDLTEAADILEAGVDIVAKPPGKQMRSINLLSGGEKCLTALALLFAIFEVKPAPFCILDEIDAPLDDTNVERFLNVVRQFTDRCQFIIITHNKRTMSIADVLFGITMQEKGVSNILSLEFAATTNTAEPSEPALIS